MDKDEFNRIWAKEQEVVLTLPPARCNPLFEPAAPLLLEGRSSAASQIVKGLVAAIEKKEAGAIDMDEDNE